MMDKRGKKELITGIKDFLRDFDEPYNHREWKHFQRYRKKNKRRPIPLFLKLTGVAASLFLIAYASMKYFPLLTMDEEREVPVPKQIPGPATGTDSLKVDTATIDSLPAAVSFPAYDVERNMLPFGQDSPVDNPVVDVVKQDKPIAKLPVREASSEGDYINATPRIVSGIESVPLTMPGGNVWEPLERKRRGGKWIRLPRLNLTGLNLRDMNLMNFENLRFGANISSAFTNKGFALGGGVSARFPITDRIVAEIGISYSRMKAGNDRTVDKLDTVVTQLAGTRDIIGMVSIPVSLGYTFSESFSASVGVQPFRAVGGRRIDILQTNRWISGGNSPSDTVGRIISERREVSRPDTLYRGNSYWGFVQLSGYYSPAFLKRYNMVVAPYVGIPIGRLRDDRNRWLHGGVAFRFYLPQKKSK